HTAALREAYNACVGAVYATDWCEVGNVIGNQSWLASGFRASRRRPRIQQLLPPPADDDGAFVRAEARTSRLVQVDFSVARTLEHHEVAERAVHSCLDDISMLSRHRLDRRMDESGNEEQRILRLGDAFTVAGADAPSHLRAWWWDDTASSDPYRGFAVGYALSVCSGAGIFRILGALIQDLPADAHAEVEAVADALELVSRPEHQALIQHWQRAPSPVLRAVAIELGGRRLGKPPELEPLALCQWLVDPNPCVVVSALRGLARAQHIPPELAPAVEQLLLGGVSGRVSFEAARCLALCGSAAPYLVLRSDGRLLDAIGERALELLLWFGDLNDAGLFSHILQSRPPTAYTLECAALFGIPESYAYLLHALEQEDLEDDAANALQVLLGPIHEDLAKIPSAWKRHLRQLNLQSGVRYRWGRPWQPSCLTSEVQRAELSRRGLGMRLDELCVRLGGIAVPSLSDWDDVLKPALGDLLSGLGNVGSKLRPGDYYCHTRQRHGTPSSASPTGLTPKPAGVSSARI
ncbi:MAG: hypothetical protein KC492_42935, partial [Myxococcales bacterium]|nr:hypothetical protein [Myxococcales bacterium]